MRDSCMNNYEIIQLKIFKQRPTVCRQCSWVVCLPIESYSHLGAYKLQLIASLRLRVTYSCFSATLRRMGPPSCLIVQWAGCAAYLSFDPLQHPCQLSFALSIDYLGILLGILNHRIVGQRTYFALFLVVKNLTRVQALRQKSAIYQLSLTRKRL